MRWYRAVALDLDGTLTTGGWPEPSLLDRITELRGDGVRMLLVTGRILAELDMEFPGLADRFDVVVGENGCVIRTGDWTRALAEPVDPALMERLHAAGVAVRRGQVLLATEATADHLVLDAVRALGLDVHLMHNRGALMLVPPGVTKGTGLREALGELGISRHNTVAVGDAENDHALLAAAGLGVAVANAVASLRRRADIVVDEADGAGVTALLRGPLLDGRQRPHLARWRIVLGTDPVGQPVTTPASQTSIIISGASESGKSYLTGLIIEQLVALGYVLLVVDPEGDHVSLAALRGVMVVAGTELPDPAEVPALYGAGISCLILDLSCLPNDARGHYLDRLWQPFVEYHGQTGLPHWTVLEEAQDLSWCHDHATELATTIRWSLCLVSYQPERISADLRADMDWHIELPPGGHTAMLTPRDGRPQPFTLARRTTHHVRHRHKYIDNDLPPQARFAFRDNGVPTGVVAANLRQFLAALGTASSGTITHHAHHGDFSRWLADVYRDHVTAALTATTEHDLLIHADAERTRRLLTELITFRYLPPERTPAPAEATR